MLGNYFCKPHGILTSFGAGGNARDGYRPNLGCIENLDPLALDIPMVDGKAVPFVEKRR